MITDLPLTKIDWFPVEAGHIMIFARAIGDPNPIYADPAYAKTTRAGGVIGPPTFFEAGTHFDANFQFRPRLGQPWLGSAAEPTGLPPQQLEAGTDLHAETHFEYHMPLRPGMVLRVASRRGRTWEAQGARAGKLIFGEVINDYLDQDQRLVGTCRTVAVTTERKVEQRQPPAPAAKAGAALRLDLPASYPVAPLRAAGLKPGDRHSSVVAVNLSRAQIIQYAGASGDVSPQHVDEVYNTRVAGYPSVFGHGMLTMAMTGRMLTDWVGDGRLTKFGFQFRQQIWPGDSVVAEATVRAIAGGAELLVDLDLEVRNQNGAVLGKGYAAARLDP
jgi:acyl dehydratase